MTQRHAPTGLPLKAHGSDNYAVRDVSIEADTDAAALRAAADLLERDEFADFDIENIRFDEPMSVDRVLLVIQLRVLTSDATSSYDLDLPGVSAPATAAEVADAARAADDVGQG
jgi:hypothetical protein